MAEIAIRREIINARRSMISQLSSEGEPSRSTYLLKRRLAMAPRHVNDASACGHYTHRLLAGIDALVGAPRVNMALIQ